MPRKIVYHKLIPLPLNSNLIDTHDRQQPQDYLKKILIDLKNAENDC